LNFVSVIGYGWTGSSAYIDLLKEFSDIGALPGEFRIAKDPYGLVDLEESLVHNWDYIRNDIAIRDFIDYCEMLSRDTSFFKKSGKNFSNKLDVDFMKESNEFIDNLTDMSYVGDTSLHRYKTSALKYSYMRLRTKYSKFNHNNSKKMYLSRPNKEKFIMEARRYINNLFSEYVRQNNISTIILDQAISPTNIVKTSAYFEKIKVIIVDRDPRDIYANLAKRNSLFGPDININNSPERYIKWHLKLRETSVNDNVCDIKIPILRVSFESLICDYEATVDKVSDFIGGDKFHKSQYKNFNPEFGKKNVGMWKKYKDQKVMEKISKELQEYCYKDGGIE
jgi:hypothetical protein